MVDLGLKCINLKPGALLLLQAQTSSTLDYAPGSSLIVAYQGRPGLGKATLNPLCASRPCPVVSLGFGYNRPPETPQRAEVLSRNIPSFFPQLPPHLRLVHCPLKASLRLLSSLCTEDGFPPGRSGLQELPHHSFCSTLRGHGKSECSPCLYLKHKLELTCNLPVLIFTL